MGKGRRVEEKVSLQEGGRRKEARERLGGWRRVLLSLPPPSVMARREVHIREGEGRRGREREWKGLSKGEKGKGSRGRVEDKRRGEGSSRGLAPRRGLGTRKAKSASLSHVPRTSGDPPPYSPACSPRRERRRVFRALFPACDVSPRIVRPSGPGLRPGNNGDRSLRVGARSA